MTTRQRFAFALMTSALVGGLCLPAMAGELTPAQGGNAAATPAPAPAVQAAPAQAKPTQASQPAATPRAAKAAPVQHRLARVAPRPAPVESEQVAYNEPAQSAHHMVAYTTILGIAY
jgi:hypothetical protein